MKDIAPRMPTPYLQAFFAEKDIPYRIFEKEDEEGVLHLVPNSVVMEAMVRVGKHEARALENQLRRIDYHNGDVNHFLEHLAGALVKGAGRPSQGTEEEVAS